MVALAQFRRGTPRRTGLACRNLMLIFPERHALADHTPPVFWNKNSQKGAHSLLKSILSTGSTRLAAVCNNPSHSRVLTWKTVRPAEA